MMRLQGGSISCAIEGWLNLAFFKNKIIGIVITYGGLPIDGDG
jgi:hypothetical protein